MDARDADGETGDAPSSALRVHLCEWQEGWVKPGFLQASVLGDSFSHALAFCLALSQRSLAALRSSTKGGPAGPAPRGPHPRVVRRPPPLPRASAQSSRTRLRDVRPPRPFPLSLPWHCSQPITPASPTPRTVAHLEEVSLNGGVSPASSLLDQGTSPAAD